MTTADTIRLDQLDARVRAVWVRGQLLHLFAGLLALVRWAVPMFLIGMAIDWLTYMPAPWRAVMLIVIAAVSLNRAWRCGWRRLRPFDAMRAALQIEAHYGHLNSLLISAVQLRHQPAQAGGSEALRDRTCRLAEEAAASLRPEQAVPYRALRRPGSVALVLALLIAVLVALNGPFIAAGVMRIFTPWLAAAYPTNTQIMLDQDTLVVKEGDSAQIEARLGGVLPDKAKIYLRTGGGSARAIDLDVTGAGCTYTIASASRDFTYRIKAGDDRTDWQQVRVVPAPRIARVQVGLTFPDYLGREPQTVEALTLTVPEETRVNWQITLDRPIRSARFIRDGEAPEDLRVSDDGLRVAFEQGVTDSRGYQFSWVEKEHGFSFTSPRYYLQVASDQAPRVELTSPATNLVAMIGRPLDLNVRVQDDHGIGSMTVIYRVNQREDKAYTLTEPVESGAGDQPIDWDYREALPDLAVGDSVAFTVQASDRYPGPAGPHVARSETRRVTFLSQEEYLKQIEKKKDRLLSQVQTIYRQQRSAHEAVRDLDPSRDGYTQACQLEAIRQELVRDQLKETASEMQALLDDLAANSVTDAAAGESLARVRGALVEIAESHIATAASLLRDQSAVAGRGARDTADPLPASHAVNAAARELGGIVLLRSIDSAQEVYAREARMLALVQSSLRWRTLQSESSGKPAEPLWKEQEQIAAWTDRLISDLQSGMRYDKRPLAVLRLVRSVKDLRATRADARMRQAGEWIREGKATQAAGAQAGLVTDLLDAEFSVRLSGAYSTLLRTRDEVKLLLAEQSALRERLNAMPAETFEQRQSELSRAQTSLRRQLLTLLLPSVPAPRAGLFDETPPKPPPARDLLARTDDAMADALQHIQGGRIEPASHRQGEAEQVLTELVAIMDVWSVELGLQTQGLSTLVAATSERMSRIEEYERSVIGLLEKTDAAAAQEQKVAPLAESQLLLAEDLNAFIQALLKQNRQEPDQDIPPLVTRLRLAQRAALDAGKALADNDADMAIANQESAADALVEAYELVVAQNQRLALLQDLLMFQRAVGFANKYMADIVAELRDMIEASEAATAETTPALMPAFGNLRQCLVDVAPLLDLVAARLDAGTPLVFAKSDLADAMDLLQSGDKLDSIDAQSVAADSLEEVQQRVKAVQTQTGYIAEIVAFLHDSVSDAALLQSRQGEIRRKAAVATQEQLPALSQEQRELLAAAKNSGQALVIATGMPQYAEAEGLMRDALSAMESGNGAEAADQMAIAEGVLAENAESLFAVISMLHGLPGIEITTQTEPELLRLVEVLAVASAHKAVYRQTQVAEVQSLAALAARQSQLADRCMQLAKQGPPHPILDAAQRHLADAVAGFSSSDRRRLRLSQKAADEQLRHFIIEQALILETAAPVAGPSEGDPTADGPGSDSESALSAGFISDFVSGEAPKDKRTEWKVLADRNRAALNQNFARELPLEYRGLLKDYYERVAK